MYFHVCVKLSSYSNFRTVSLKNSQKKWTITQHCTSAGWRERKKSNGADNRNNNARMQRRLLWSNNCEEAQSGSLYFAACRTLARRPAAYTAYHDLSCTCSLWHLGCHHGCCTRIRKTGHVRTVHYRTNCNNVRAYSHLHRVQGICRSLSNAYRLSDFQRIPSLISPGKFADLRLLERIYACLLRRFI